MPSIKIFISFRISSQTLWQFLVQTIFTAWTCQMVAFHLERQAQVTVSAFPVLVEEGSSFGILQVDPAGRVKSFVDKPARPQALPSDARYCLASMGNYLFTTSALIELLEQDAAQDSSSHDFGRDIIPPLIGRQPVCVRFSAEPYLW